jgi:hypothetical protein
MPRAITRGSQDSCWLQMCVTVCLSSCSYGIRLAEEQTALRRVATLVAGGAAPEEVFAAVAEEVGQLLPVDSASMCRYESDGTLSFVAQWGGVGAAFPLAAGTPWGHNLGTLVFETGRLARVDGYADSS